MVWVFRNGRFRGSCRSHKCQSAFLKSGALPTPALPMRHDPILAELWAVKAQINAEANYDVKRLLDDAAATAARMTDPMGDYGLIRSDD